MAEWKQSFDRGISNFRSGKYDEALLHFDEVRFSYAPFVWGIDRGRSLCQRGDPLLNYSTLELRYTKSSETSRPLWRTRGKPLILHLTNGRDMQDAQDSSYE